MAWHAIKVGRLGIAPVIETVCQVMFLAPLLYGLLYWTTTKYHSPFGEFLLSVLSFR